MVFLIQRDCRCCQAGHLQNHCEDCWDKHHNGLRDHDFEDRSHVKDTDFNALVNKIIEENREAMDILAKE